MILLQQIKEFDLAWIGQGRLHGGNDASSEIVKTKESALQRKSTPGRGTACTKALWYNGTWYIRAIK